MTDLLEPRIGFNAWNKPQKTWFSFVSCRSARGGDRAANSALHIIAIGRSRREPRSQDCVAKRIDLGKSKLAIIRCFKRSIARELFGIIIRRHRGINESQLAPFS